MFPVMSLVSFGWASGDVSLAAYVQARVCKMPAIQNKHNISALGAVMAFLYVSYVVCFPIIGFLASLIMDHFNHPEVNDPQGAFFYIGGLVMSAAGVVIFLSTFIPRGSFALNPRPEPMAMAEPKAEPKADAEAAQAPIALEPEDAQVGLDEEDVKA
jgi:MFS family permease